MSNTNKTVVVGMSGGVDSSVAAWLLKEQGYHVIGITMQLFDNLENDACGGLDGIDDAQKVADAIGIKHHIVDFKKEFKTNVIDYFVHEYEIGRTPNPCNACNRHIKWEALLMKAKELGADYLATGHYARIEHLDNGRYAIKNSVTATKDQTYALYNLTQEQLAHTLMPIGAFEKSKIREIAIKENIPVANKPDSQDICFVPDGDYAKVVCQHTGCTSKPGNFVSKDGEIFGQHKGIIHYTIGQRKGLGIAFGKPMYVVGIRPETNEVVLGKNEDLFVKTLTASHLNPMGVERFTKGMEMVAKIRYSHKGERCRVTSVTDDTMTIEFENAVRAVTPGQALVCYDGDIVLGGGIIEG